ncbi:Fe-S cluster assembly protein SufD [Mycetocola reblochoni]|uniref:Iron-sulfur cluster assembly protein SufD n=2 Tax=Mycetocola reblochoni TaxID=331618 RepID=A0A1R4J5I7_9MICO|nr:Fe-S cluster assembly protein SufD [Mycetocola reblochoni]RLP69561.1 Fe-S cluster assembly protein SufD [Mycetocola reblochoni]SJN27194.1 Iron-sulfur cluster assembly protein SufD [Mycetocola reblochoni REB411]
MSTQAPESPTALPEGQHGLRRHSDGAGAFVPVQTRSERFRSTSVGDFDEVTGREAVWKLSPVDRFRDLLAETLDGGPTPIDVVSAPGTTVAWVDRTEARTGRAGTPEDRAAAAAWTNTEQVLAITVDGESDENTTVRRHGFGSAPRAAHVVVEALPHSRGTVILDHSGTARLTENVEVVVGEGAHVTVVTVQDWDDDAVHLSSHFARVGRDATLKHVVVSLGGGVVRVNPSTHLAEQGSGVDALGVYFADAGQHLEQQVYVHHDAPNSRSRVSYKGALQGTGARTVWIGDVLIGRDATATDSYEQNRNLVLTDGTRADSIPNLEIETGDIAGAGHASATGRFDDEQLFYLQARGIPEDQARRLVVLGFLIEIVQQIGDSALEARLEEAIEAELRGGSAATAP